MYVGGEFFQDGRCITDHVTPAPAQAYFLNGGRACLRLISVSLLSQGIRTILLPSYLCPTILDVFDKFGLTYGFYQVNADLSLDLQDLNAKAASYKALYFINYFGFQHNSETLDLLLDLQKNGKVLVEDNAHGGYLHSGIGDFVFCSMRKLCPFDGGYMATRNIDLRPLLPPTEPVNHRLPLIREYRQRLRNYLFNGREKRAQLERLFYQAESLYELDQVITGDPSEKEAIEHLDWPAIQQVRRANYAYLLDKITEIPHLTPLFPTLPSGIMPMGMPVYINNCSRDPLLERLAEESISLTVHWDALQHDPRLSVERGSREMAGHMLTLPVDQYTTTEQLDYLVDQLTFHLDRLTDESPESTQGSHL